MSNKCHGKKIPHYAVIFEAGEEDRIVHESYIRISVATFEVAFFILTLVALSGHLYTLKEHQLVRTLATVSKVSDISFINGGL